MSSPHFAMVDIPLDGELRWGTRTAAALHDEPAVAGGGGVRIFYATQQRDIEEPTRVQLAHTAHDVLRAPGLRRKLAQARRSRARWFLWEAENRLRELAPDQLAGASSAVLEFDRATEFYHQVLIEVSAAPAGAATDTFLATLRGRLKLVTAAPAVARGAGFAPTLRLDPPPQDDPDDVRALRDFREALLARDWPDSAAVGRQLGSSGASALSRVSRERAAGTLFGVWAGRDRSGYRHPDFQFLPSGSVHPRLPELLDALARQLGLTPLRDRSGWERAYWFYQPRGRLSAQALALRAAAPEQLHADPERFAALDTAARTPAELFLADPQAVIDLARDDAAAQTPPDAPEGARG